MRGIFNLTHALISVLFILLTNVSIAWDQKTHHLDSTPVDTIKLHFTNQSTDKDLSSGMFAICTPNEDGARLCNIRLVNDDQLPTQYPVPDEKVYQYENVTQNTWMTFNIFSGIDDEYLCGGVIFGNTGLVATDSAKLNCEVIERKTIDNDFIIYFNLSDKN